MYRYFYSIKIVHSNMSERILFIKSKSILTVHQAARFLFTCCVITDSEYNDFFVYTPITQNQYDTSCPKCEWVIKSYDTDDNKSEVYDKVPESDFGDMCYELFEKVNYLRIFKPYIRQLQVLNITQQTKFSVLVR